MSRLNNSSQYTSSSTRVFFKIHRKNRTEILALCDESLLGQELFNEKARMRIPIDFYRGQEISADDALRLLRNYANVNAVGSVLELGIKENLINEDAIIWFTTSEGKKIPHLLIFSIPPI
ncbi:MAG: DUF424 family protein [Candidatus Heimdallarchaeota archaeon]|nr:MAG: DUF424 family protein [Candidatus Heimdallarchaeota archaeon]